MKFRLVLALASLVTTGCASTNEVVIAARPSLDAARSCLIFDGVTGEPVTWDEVLDRVGAAQAIVVGETHNDAMGHAMQAALVEDMVTRWPRTTLALEMLERHEQGSIDDYLDGLIDQSEFAEVTHSAGWAGAGSWEGWYQPIIDVIKVNAKNGADVVGANAPRRYVKLARKESYERLAEMTPPRRDWFDIPDQPSADGYDDRFFELMGYQAPEEGESDDEERTRLESVFRSQSVWDTTMARSMVRALDAGADKVVLLIGQFHSDFNGGAVQQFRYQRPDVPVLVISLQPMTETTLRDEDQDRAGLVIYTGGGA